MVVCRHCAQPVTRPVYTVRAAWHAVCLAERIAVLREIVHDATYDALSRQVARVELVKLTS